MEIDSVPEHLLVLGGGYIGLEFGQMFRRFGSRVTIVQSGAQLIRREDPDVATEVGWILKQDAIELLLTAKAERVAKSAGGIQICVRSGGEPRTLSGTHLLVATGRVPNTDTLNVAAAGISTDPKSFIQVNSRLETNVEGIYALGDIKGGLAFTHISYDDFRILRTNLIEKGSDSTEGRLVPYTVFMDPQLGRIGLTETEARAQNIKVRVAKMPMNYVARALEVDEPRGFLKVVSDAETNQILGSAVLAIDAVEFMAILQITIIVRPPFTPSPAGTSPHP